MTVIDLTPIYKRLAEGLAQGPEQSDWDPETVLWSCSGWAQFGAVDGWLWATDGSTALIEKAVDVDDLERDERVGRRVLAMCSEDLPGRYRVMLHHLAIAGGKARIPTLGDFDLDRLWQAALFVGGGAPETDDDRTADSVLLHIERTDRDGKPYQIAHIMGEHERQRRAVVMGTEFTGDWFPTIDLPFEIVETPSRAD